MTNDNQLAKSAANGDRQSMEQLYQRWVDPIYRYCWWKSGSGPDAQDLTAETMLEMVKNIKNFAGRGQFKNWLYAIAKITVIHYYQKKYRQPLVKFNDSIQLLEEPRRPPGSGKMKLINEILRSLPQKYQQVLQLRFIQNYSLSQTAQVLNLSVANIKVIQHRALKKAAKYEL